MATEVQDFSTCITERGVDPAELSIGGVTVFAGGQEGSMQGVASVLGLQDGLVCFFAGVAEGAFCLGPGSFCEVEIGLELVELAHDVNRV
jgi:hypothetical protein